MDGLLRGLTPEGDLAAVQRVWAAAVGPAIAAAGRPVGLVDGVLYVRCEDATWAHELQLMERRIVERLQAAGGPTATAVRSIRTASGAG